MGLTGFSRFAEVETGALIETLYFIYALRHFTQFTSHPQSTFAETREAPIHAVPNYCQYVCGNQDTLPMFVLQNNRYAVLSPTLGAVDGS